MNKILNDTVTLSPDGSALLIIDQSILPGEIKIVSLRETEEIYDAIKKLRVRGAPAIGVAAAGGAYLAARRILGEMKASGSFTDDEAARGVFLDRFYREADYIRSARPTAVNLMWAVDRMKKLAEDVALSKGAEAAVEALYEEAKLIKEEDVDVCRRIGDSGLSLLKDGMTILTHCNAGRLAAVRYGTALAPVYRGLEKGMNIKVFADETRPLLQGARLTSFELHNAGVDVTLICDNMASTVMKAGKIDAVITGCDRVAANGDAANKIGTSGVAALAKYYGIPFYIAAPTSTIDMSCPTGDDIVIEERDPDEVAEAWYKERMAPEGIKIYNPAFDVTDHSLITAMITEKGVIREPYTESIAGLFE